jgi:hypothetical protein
MRHLILAAAAGTIMLTACSGTGTDPDAGEASPHPRPAWAFYRPPVPLPRRAPVPSAASDLNAWIVARFHGAPPPDDCS